jgi:hypothetical protein
VVITLGPRRVRGLASGGLLEIEVALDANGLAWPDGEWLELFREYPDFPPDLEEPRLEHGKLRFEASDADLARAWSAIKQRVAATNRMYEAILEPRDRESQQGEDARRSDVEGHIRDAQRLLDSLE